MTFLLLLGTIVVPLLAVPALYVLGKRFRQKSGWVAFAVLLLPVISILLAGRSSTYEELYPWSPIGQFGLRVDNLSLPIGFTIALLSALIAVYSIPYMAHRFQDKSHFGLYYALYVLYAVGMIGTVLATNLIQFYVFFEIMLVPSFLLIAEWGYGDRQRISLMYFLWTHLGALALLVGILTTGYYVGGMDLAFIASRAGTLSELARLAIVVAMSIGFLVKMAMFGVHIWLPHAHAEAPTPISALLSPAMIGIGAYAIARIVMTIFPESFSTLSLIFAVWALITMFYGGAMALVQQDVKRLLAYSSVSQMGYILLGLAAVQPLGLAGSMFQYVSHGTAKGILFMAAGAIMLQANGERDISRLGGLASKMPVTATAVLIGFLALLGLPSTNGFISEFFIFQGFFQSAIETGSTLRLVIAGLGVIASALTAGYALWTVRRIFFGKTPEHLTDVREAPKSITVPILTLAAVTILLGIYPELILGRLVPAASTILPGSVSP